MSIKKPYVILPTDSKQARQIDEMFGILFDHLTSATVANVRHIVIPSFGSDESVTTGDGTIGITIPEEMNNYVLTDALCSVYSPSTTGNINVQLRHSRAGTDVDLLTDKIVILEDGYYDKVSHINKVVYKGDIIFADIDLPGSGVLGLFTVLTFRE